MKRLFYISFMVAGMLAIPRASYAQIVCTGPGCAYLPVSQATLDQMFYDFKTQYTDKLFTDMATAGALANTTGAPTGTVNLYKFTVGLSVGAGYVPVTTQSIPITGYGEIKDIPRAGGAVNPRMFGGVNLGWLLNSPYDPWEADSSEPWFLSPAKFDVYANVIQDKRHFDNDQGKLVVQTRNQGFDVRYHLVEGKPLAMGPLLRFLGVSVGTGYHQASLEMEATQTKNQKLKLNLSSGNLIWDGSTIAKMSTKVKTTPVEIMTGLQILYILNFSFGGGVSLNKGNSDFTLTRVGPVYVNNDAAALLAAANGQTLASSAYTSYLTMQISGSGAAPASVAYGKIGVDLNLLWLKVFAEGLIAKRVYGANLGVRFQM